jgi:hypothetical protein
VVALTAAGIVAAAAGDLVGNWSWTVWLLIPLILGLAVITSLTLGSLGEPERASARRGGVSRFLDSDKDAS